MKLKVGQLITRILYLVVFIIICGTILFFIFKDSQYASTLRNWMGNSPIVEADSLRDSNIDIDSISEKRLDSDFFKFKTTYDTLVEEETMSSGTGTNTPSETEIQDEPQDTTTNIVLTKQDSIQEINQNTNRSLTSGSPIPQGEAVVSAKPDSYDDSYDLFDELLLPAENRANSTLRASINTKKDALGRKSTLKILSICSKNIILNDNKEDSEEILYALAHSESIRSIKICDRNGKVLFSTNKKNLNQLISAVYPELSLNEEKLSCNMFDKSDVCTFPIFHTYGKIGNAIVVYKND